MKIPAFGIDFGQKKSVQIQNLKQTYLSGTSSVSSLLPGVSSSAGLFGRAETGQDKLNGILDKLRLGSKLSDKEKSYLQKYSPVYHQKSLLIEQDRKLFRSELKSCQSKQDVHSLHQRKIMDNAAQAHSANQVASAGAASGLQEQAGMRLAAINDEHREFTQSIEYHRLPRENKTKSGRRIRTIPAALPNASDIRSKQASYSRHGKRVMLAPGESRIQVSK